MMTASRNNRSKAATSRAGPSRVAGGRVAHVVPRRRLPSCGRSNAAGSSSRAHRTDSDPPAAPPHLADRRDVRGSARSACRSRVSVRASSGAHDACAERVAASASKSVTMNHSPLSDPSRSHVARRTMSSREPYATGANRPRSRPDSPRTSAGPRSRTLPPRRRSSAASSVPGHGNDSDCSNSFSPSTLQRRSGARSTSHRASSSAERSSVADMPCRISYVSSPAGGSAHGRVRRARP
jgi:hypothetical protein